MAVKRKYVIATTDKYPDGTIRPAAELEAASRRIDRIPLTLGHPPKGTIAVPENILLGTATLSFDKKTGTRQIGDLYFYDEYWDRLPEHLKGKVVNHDNIPVSPGFGFRFKEENIIGDIMPHHLAVLVDEKPLCPLDTCGVNVRMESDSNMNFRYEHRTEASDPDKPAEPSSIKEAVNLGMMIGELKAEVASLRQELAAAKTPVLQKQEVKENPEEAQEERAPEPASEEQPTRRVLPAGEVKSEDELQTDKFGRIIVG